MRRREFITLLGGAVALPRAVRAQQSTFPLIGFMNARSAAGSVHAVAAFLKGLADSGYVEDQNLTIEYRWADGDSDKLPKFAAELVNRGVAVLVATGGELSALAARRATSTIPVVFGVGGDPTKLGLVNSFNRPGGNATGYTLLTSQLESKRLGLLHELVPNVSLVGLLLDPTFPSSSDQLHDLETAAPSIGIRLIVARASNDTELKTAFDSFVEQRAGALFVSANPFFDTRRDQIIAFATQNRLPDLYQFREFAVDGGLTSYGPSIIDGYRQAGVYTAQILKGAKPGDLPVMQPTKFEFVLNLKTAKQLGVSVPPTLLARADEVIE